jgi:toxin ParE1/3/4
MAEVRWTNQSLDDINNIAEFIAKDSVRYATLQVERFFELSEILEQQPNAGRVVPEFHDETLRELILGNYRLIYLLVSKDRIDILTVHHSRRLLSNNPTFKNE